MKAFAPFSLRCLHARIIPLLTIILIYDAFEVYGFQNNGSIQQQLKCRSTKITENTDATFVSYATAFDSNNSRTNKNRMERTILSMAIPTLDKWKVIQSGSVIGTVRNHPYISDGDVITTSPINNPEFAARQSTVTTMSGSKYKLLEPRGAISAEAQRREAAALAAALAQAEQDYQNENNNAQTSPPEPPPPKKSNWFGGWQGPLGGTNKVNGASEDESRKREMIRRSPEWAQAARKYSLNGEMIGLEDDYLLAKKPEKSTSGKSDIWEAYKTEESTGMPADNAIPVCLKISSNLEAISREYENYRKLSFMGIWETGRFVRCYEFFPVAGYDKKYRNQCALAIEKGSRDLKAFLNSRGKLEKKELRDACTSATQCVQALHNAGLVWTDMKTENFVVMPDGDVKGIDLESAMPIGDYPVDYSPEACPPEFAVAFLEGDGPYFELDSSYDVWSLGMLMMELSTGMGYFDGKSPIQITKELRDMDESTMRIDLQSYDIDNRLKDLIAKCLQKDPKKRPSASQILMHPYFLAGNPFAFLSMGLI